MELKKHKGSTKDHRGCHFNYVAYRTVEQYYDLNEHRIKTRVIESLYCDEQDPSLKAETLEGLKELMTKL